MKMNDIARRPALYFTGALVALALGGCLTEIGGVGTGSSSGNGQGGGSSTGSCSPTTGTTSTGGAGGAGQGGAPPGLPQAGEYFVETVYPELASACGPCHAVGQAGAPVFLAGDPSDAYTLIHTYKKGALAAPAVNNPLLLKGQHLGPALSSMEKAHVTQWLSLEWPGLPPQP